MFGQAEPTVIELVHVEDRIPPENSHLEPKNGGLENDFPFQTGDFKANNTDV